MNCYIHPDREAAGTCSNCGNAICAECAATVAGKTICPPCAAKGIPVPASKPTNTLAILSLIFGIVSVPTAICYGCGAVFAITAIITGFIARRQIQQAGGAQSGNGIALAGLILGIVVTALVLLGGLCYLLIFVFALLSPSGGSHSLLPGLWNLALGV